MFVQEMPPLTSYLHRAMSTMREINENVSLRNSLIAGHALEGAEGMTPERYAYYASMLSGLGDYLCQSVDNDLQFFSLTTEQIELFMMARNKGGNHLRFELNDRVSETIPKEDLFPTLRAQMTTFNDPPEN